MGELSRLSEGEEFGRGTRFVETEGRRPHQSERLCDAVAQIVSGLAVDVEQPEDQTRVTVGGRGTVREMFTIALSERVEAGGGRGVA